jgi:hypothetical protein
MFEFKPDFEEVRKRFEAWWECEIIDRPLTSIEYPRVKGTSDAEAFLRASKEKMSMAERSDPERFALRQLEWVGRNVYYGDALPVDYASLGPETIAAFYGCPVEYEGHIVWSEPILPSLDAADTDKIRFDENNFYFRRVMEMTDALLEIARDKFIVGYPNFLGAIDVIAAMRDQANLCSDLLHRPDDVAAFADRLTGEILGIYDLYHDKLSAEGLPSAAWLYAVCEGKGKFHIPSCDFSCMISDEMFEEIVLPQIIREVRHMDRNIYHLDGPGALRHLDRLLEIPEIQAYQWVPTGYHSDAWPEWIDVYKRMQAAGRGFVVPIEAKDLEDFFEHLRPEGVWLSVSGVTDQDEADAVLKTVAKWR